MFLCPAIAKYIENRYILYLALCPLFYLCMVCGGGLGTCGQTRHQEASVCSRADVHVVCLYDGSIMGNACSTRNRMVLCG